VFSTEIVDHGGRRGDAMRGEALVVLHRAMRPATHCRIRMVVEIVVDLPAFLSR
jgi:hypothetical protein